MAFEMLTSKYRAESISNSPDQLASLYSFFKIVSVWYLVSVIDKAYYIVFGYTSSTWTNGYICDLLYKTKNYQDFRFVSFSTNINRSWFWNLSVKCTEKLSWKRINFVIVSIETTHSLNIISLISDFNTKIYHDMKKY